MPTPCQTVTTCSADNMPFPADNFAGMKVGDVRTNFDHFPDKFVANRHRNGNRPLSPGIPFVNVDVRPADPRLQNLDQDIVDTDRRFWNVLKPQANCRFSLDQSLHSNLPSG